MEFPNRKRNSEKYSCLFYRRWRQSSGSSHRLPAPPFCLRLDLQTVSWAPASAPATVLQSVLVQGKHLKQRLVSIWCALSPFEMYHRGEWMPEFILSLKTVRWEAQPWRQVITIFHHSWGEFHLQSQVGTAGAWGLFKSSLPQPVTKMLFPTEQNHQQQKPDVDELHGPKWIWS